MANEYARLPQLLERKIYKTGQTRGADDDVIYQNRVGRNSTVLIPYSFWINSFKMPEGEKSFENGFIVLISPSDYFQKTGINEELTQQKLKLGKNALVFYETREQWLKYNPEPLGWKAAQRRSNPLGGQYVARIPATTALNGGHKIIHGFTTTAIKGAGIRVFEYASNTTIKKCRFQLEALFWLCNNSEEIVAVNGMSSEDAAIRKAKILEYCANNDLLDYQRLQQARMLNGSSNTVCPLCLDELSAGGFFARMQQAAGREVPDLTVTEINLFHIEELRTGIYNHIPYNLGWGHHHCNVVTKDSGIFVTLEWMRGILERNSSITF